MKIPPHLKSFLAPSLTILSAFMLIIGANYTHTQRIRNSAKAASSNVVLNPNFESGTANWNFYAVNSTGTKTGTWESSSAGAYNSSKGAKISLSANGTNVQLYQYGIPIKPGKTYTLTFMAKSNTGHNLWVALIKHGSPYTNYGLPKKVFDITTGWAPYSIEFTSNSSALSDARLMFFLGDHDAAGDIYYLDNVSLTPASSSGGSNITSQALKKVAVLIAGYTNFSPAYSENQGALYDEQMRVAYSQPAPAVNRKEYFRRVFFDNLAVLNCSGCTFDQAGAYTEIKTVKKTLEEVTGGAFSIDVANSTVIDVGPVFNSISDCHQYLGLTEPDGAFAERVYERAGLGLNPPYDIVITIWPNRANISDNNCVSNPASCWSAPTSCSDYFVYPNGTPTMPAGVGYVDWKVSFWQLSGTAPNRKVKMVDTDAGSSVWSAVQLICQKLGSGVCTFPTSPPVPTTPVLPPSSTPTPQPLSCNSHKLFNSSAWDTRDSTTWQQPYTATPITSVQRGGRYLYEIVYKNNTSGTLTGVALKDTLPPQLVYDGRAVYCPPDLTCQIADCSRTVRADGYTDVTCSAGINMPPGYILPERFWVKAKTDATLGSFTSSAFVQYPSPPTFTSPTCTHTASVIQ